MRAGPTIVLTIAIVAGVFLVGSAATGRLPVVMDSCAKAAGSLEAMFRSLAGPVPAMDGGAPSDAGPSSHRQTAPLSTAQLSAPLIRGGFVRACGAPDDMKAIVNVTVKMGRVADVHATTVPPNPSVESCIERATRELQWDVSPKAGHVTVRY